MKKLLSSLGFFAKAVLLIALLIAGWVFISTANLVKGKNSVKKNAKNVFIDSANADVPPIDIGGCPHVAFFDGQRFVIENDFLLGKPKSFFSNFSLVKKLYEAGRIGPDLLRFSNVPKLKNGKLAVELQEFEEEETFVDWLKMIRVVHPKLSEVIVNSNFESFHVFDREKAEKEVILPSVSLLNGKPFENYFNEKKVLWNLENNKDRIFQRGDKLSLEFSNIESDKPLLILQTVFRDWMMGVEAPQSLASKILYSPRALQAGLLLSGAAYLLFGRKYMGNAMAVLPFVIGSGAESKSLIVSFKDENGRKHELTVHEPRDWRRANEALSLPKEAFKADGSLTIEIEFTKKHKLSFVGVLSDNGAKVKEERLFVEHAEHNRKGDVTSDFIPGNGSYGHMIPGDKIEVAFNAPTEAVKKGEKETYIMQSSGFYTCLRKEKERLAGNWREKMPTEAREQLSSLKPLKNYS